MPISSSSKKRVLIFIVAYNAEKTIQSVIRRIPRDLSRFETEILIIDDSSKDRTFENAHACEQCDIAGFPTTVLYNPVNQGYGGNQKLGFHYAIQEKFDFVALIHGDGQYAPEELPRLLQPLVAGEADAVFGSRMMTRFGALHGGMPLYKFIGNKILTAVQNHLLGARLSEFHSGYRLYSIEALRRIPFERNSNDFHFDTEIIIQLLRAGLRIKELPIPTYYGDEICHVNGMPYAFNVIRATLLARAQDCGIFYDAKYAVSVSDTVLYQSKLRYLSPHTLAIEKVAAGSSVLDVGCASGYVARCLRKQGCPVMGVDCVEIADRTAVDEFIAQDLNTPIPIDVDQFDYVLLLDVLEHLHSPEAFVDWLRHSRTRTADTIVIASTGNIGFIVTRLMLLLGYFHYGARGLLDRTHTRLFTFATFQHLFKEAGYQIDLVRGIPVPYPLALGDGFLARFLLRVNTALIRVWRTLFSYQIFIIARPLPTVQTLFQRAVRATEIRVAAAR